MRVGPATSSPRSNMSRWLVQILTGVVTIIATTLLARTFIALRPPPWSYTEDWPLAIWSVPLALAVITANLLLTSRASRLGRAWRGLLCIVVGFFLGSGWAFAAYYLTGGYVLAFDVPVLYCWSGGATLGLAFGLLWRSGREAGGA